MPLGGDYWKDIPYPPADGAVWGIGDYHTHPMSHLAFGALRGVRPLWGRPGTNAALYDNNPALFEADIPPCPNDHLGGHTAALFINNVEKRLEQRDLEPGSVWARVRLLLRAMTGALSRHPGDGAPSFEDYPHFLAGAHQQMHVTQIRRAWQGGLRLMVALAVHNEGVEYLSSPPREDRPSTDRQALEAQVCGMRRLAGLNADWMQIVYGPAQAREAIRAGKLAIVLGAELDRLGEFEGFTSADAEVQYLWDLGIRQVTPIHGIDNTLGGAAVFEPAYNSLNDLLYRTQLNLTPSQLDRVDARFFEVREGCAPGALTSVRGECVMYRMPVTQGRPVVKRMPFSWFQPTPFLQDWDVPAYKAHTGHMNAQGLTPKGRTYVQSLLRRGMLVGLEHMSQRSAEDVYALAAERPGGGRWPLMVSHAHFRALSIHERRRTTADVFRPEEYEIGDRTLQEVRRSGGVVGVFTSEDPIEEHPDVIAPFANDCAMSSKTFGYSLLYGLAKMGGTGVGLATDFTFIPGTAPRFGANACWGLKDHYDATPEKLGAQYAPTAQQHGVVYRDRPAGPWVKPGTNAPLVPYRMGRRTFDFNVDGFAHYGLLPDLLQDLKNVGLPAAAFESLFSSAEAYVAMWEKAAGASDATAMPATFTPLELPCERICRGLCP